MSRIAYVNGAYRAHKDASVSIDDRGYQFADGVYEVFPVNGGRLIDQAMHIDRLERSLEELHIRRPLDRRSLPAVMEEVVARNRVGHGILYLQVTRGVAPRDHAIPTEIKPSLVITSHAIAFEQMDRIARKGVNVVTVEDIRWDRRDIKSISLLPNVLAKTEARERGASEAWMVDEEGFITEGSSANAWIVTQKGEIVTRPADNDILNGITRRNILSLAQEADIPVIERPFNVEEVIGAAEAFLSSSSRFCFPVTEINGTTIADGKPGPITLEIRRLLLRDAGLIAGNST